MPVWTAFPSSDYYAPSATSCGIGDFVGVSLTYFHSPWHPAGRFPCSQRKTQVERRRWRVRCLPLPRFVAPQSFHRVGQVYLCLPADSLGQSLLAPYSAPHKGFGFDWLAYQGRYARVRIHRRAMHASGDSPYRSSAKHHLLETSLPLMVPFRVMLLTS